MAQPRKVSDAAREEIFSVAQARARIPSDKQLVAKHHISRRRLQQIMSEARLKLHKEVGSTWSETGDTALMTRT